MKVTNTFLPDILLIFWNCNFRMTSTNINIGLSDGKNSSRVLRPPGGGHSDIFSVQSEEEPSIPKRAPTKTQISECFCNDSDIPKPPTTDIDKEAIEENVHNHSKEGSNETAPRVRVPPGGFSSGFW